jgi:hypothetical protein
MSRRNGAFMNRLLLCSLVAGLLFACTSSEERARSLYNQALAAEREGHGEQAEALLKKVIADYPQTQVATEANEALNKRKAAGDLVSGIVNVLEGSTRAANEKAAILNMHTISTASVTFFSINKGRYPRTLKELVDAELLDERFVGGMVGGYRSTLQPRGNDTYEAYAEPTSSSGGRFFYSDETAVVRYENGRRAGKNSPRVD